jgi:hypothetical protein
MSLIKGKTETVTEAHRLILYQQLPSLSRTVLFIYGTGTPLKTLTLLLNKD